MVMTNGSGSPRDDLYRDYTDEAMRAVRAEEQNKAAIVGGYAAQILFDYPSSAVKDNANQDPVEDLVRLFEIARPEVVYTHNLADKHPSHVGTALKVIDALRSLPAAQRPDRLYGCEVWRDLGWMCDEDKVVFDCSPRESLQWALLGVFDSQICGGKRYDLAAMSRRRANATYFESHGVDTSTGLAFGMDLTPLIKNPDMDIRAYVQGFIDRFAEDVYSLIGRME